MFQGSDVAGFNYEPLSFTVKNISAVLLTHAHLDHCGRLPLLIKAGYSGKIYTTLATKLLVTIALMDAVKIAIEHQQDHPLLYSEEDVQKTLQLIEVVSYDEVIMVEQVKIIFHNAGHILGSASIEIQDSEKTILFSGDLGNPYQRLLQPTEHISHADIVVMESTYGDRIHPVPDALLTLEKEILAVEQSGGVLLLPAFALDRTQVLLHLLNHLKKKGVLHASVPVFLDSPMGIRATSVYMQSSNLWSDELRQHTTDPFSFPGLIVTEDAKDSEKILKVPGPKIIIAGNGMMNGGRIWHHLINYLPLVSTRLVIVGYQGKGTVGREIIEGAKQITIYHEKVSVNAVLSTVQGLSAHADKNELLSWLQQIKGVQKIFITHGEDSSRHELAEMIKSKTTIPDILIPTKDSDYLM